MENEKEDISIERISELLKKCPEDDGTFLDCLYKLYFFIGITKGVEDAKNGNGISLEESKERMRRKFENYSTKYGS